MRVDNSLEKLAQSAKQREQEEVFAQRRAREDQASAQTQNEIMEKIASFTRAQAAEPDDKICAPNVREVEEQLISKADVNLFRQQIADSSAWKAFVAACSARDQRVRAAESFRIQQETADLPRKISAAIESLVQRSLASQGDKVAAAGFPYEIAQLPLIIQPDISAIMTSSESSMLNGNIPMLPLQSWIALIAQANPDAQFSPAHDADLHDPAFAIKVPGQRTVFISFRRDGNELFPAKMQLPDRVVVDTPSSNRMPLTSALIDLTGLKSVVAELLPSSGHD